MTKTAYLYTFYPRTRVIADPTEFDNEEDFFEHLSAKAREQMCEEIEMYLNGENGEYEEDTEVPYGEGYKDEEK